MSDQTMFTVGGYGIVLENSDKVLKAIKNIAPDIDKEMKKRLREVGNRIITTARSNVPADSPLSNWGREPKNVEAWHARNNKNNRVRYRPGGFPTYDSGKIKKGLRANTGKPKGAKFGAILYLTNRDAAGAIFELAGRKSEGKRGTGGPNFIKVLNDYESASRVIWDAYDSEGRNKIQEEIIDIVNDAQAELNRRFGDDGFTEVRR